MTKTKQTIIINGRLYNAATGLPVAQAPKTTTKTAIINDVAPSAISSIPAAPQIKQRQAAPHRVNTVQKSTTLRRSALKKPSSPRQPVAKKVHRKIERSQRISRFAPLKNNSQTLSSSSGTDPELAKQAEQLRITHKLLLKKQAEENSRPAISSRTIKEHLLKQQLEKAPADTPHHEVYQAGRLSPRARLASVATTSLALILLGGYLTYINIPNLSIRVAAANAGIDASLPRYQPDGYRIHGPIAYTDGQVSVGYQRNGGEQSYRIIQKASAWDPQATLDNYVKPESHNNYQIHSAQGLTVYTYNNKAVWVNGGILHLIDGNTPLSGQEVEQIAVSM